MDKNRFVARCIKAIQLADRIIQETAITENQIPTSTPAAHPAYAKIFELAYKALANDEEEGL
jgi:hypothetical protein